MTDQLVGSFLADLWTTLATITDLRTQAIGAVAEQDWLTAANELERMASTARCGYAAAWELHHLTEDASWG